MKEHDDEYIKYIFSKDTYQQLLIIRTLFNSPEGLDIDSLTRLFNLDRRNIYNHINSIKKICDESDDSGSIIVSKKWEYYFTGNKIAYYNLRSHILESEFIIKLSTLFLQTPSVNFTDFCKNNFVGESTLKRKISKINKLLKNYNIKISFKKNYIYILLEKKELSAIV